jgi:hypothetical protein
MCSILYPDHTLATTSNPVADLLNNIIDQAIVCGLVLAWGVSLWADTETGS